MRSEDLLKIGTLAGIIFVGFLVYMVIVDQILQRRKNEQKVFVEKKLKARRFRLLELYNRLERIKPARRYLEKLRKIYEIRMPGDTRECKESAMKMALIMWVTAIAAVLVSIVFHLSFYQIGCVLVTAYVLCDSAVVMTMERYDNIIISELDKFIDLVQFHYFNTGMVDHALLSAMQETKSKLMQLHGQQIYDVLMDTKDFEYAVRDYNIRNSDFYIKAFAEAIFVVYQYGDKIVDEESLFISTLRSLKNDVRDEMLKRRSISSKFSGAVVCVVAPIYFLDQLKGIGMDNFSTLADIYYGTYGTLCVAFIFICDLIVYKIIGIMRTFVKVEKDNTGLLQAVYSIRPFKRMINSLVYRNWGKTLRLRTLLRKTGNSLNEYLFTTKRVLYFCLFFVGMLIFLNAMHVRNHSYYVTRVIDIGSTTSGASDEESFQMVLLGRHYIDKYKEADVRDAYNKVSGKQPDMHFDDEVFQWFVQNVYDDLSFEPAEISIGTAFSLVDEYLEEHAGSTSTIKNLKGLTYEEAMASEDHMVTIGMNRLKKLVRELKKPAALPDSLLQTVADKVAYKIQKSQNEYFHWYDLVVAFACGVAAYFYPLILLYVEKKAMQMDMEDEIVQYQSVILVLMHMERMTVEKILEWMLMFSRIFEESLRKCVNDLPLGEKKALEQLAKDEPFESFTNLVNDLVMCDKISIKRAFGSLKSDRKNYQEKRKLENEISVANRASIANFLVFVPFMIVVVGYLVIPFVMAAIGDFTNMMDSVQSVTGGM